IRLTERAAHSGSRGAERGRCDHGKVQVVVRPDVALRIVQQRHAGVAESNAEADVVIDGVAFDTVQGGVAIDRIAHNPYAGPVVNRDGIACTRYGSSDYVVGGGPDPVAVGDAIGSAHISSDAVALNDVADTCADNAVSGMAGYEVAGAGRHA